MRTKARLTITLDQDLLQQLDQLIDGGDIKNRSNAIETLVKNSLSPTVHTAVILAGGKIAGTHPALQKIGNSSVLTQTLKMLKKHGLSRVIICLNKTDKQIAKAVGSGEHFGLKVEYAREDKPLGTGGAVKQLEPQLKNESFLVIHGDISTNINLSELIAFHFSEKVIATIAVKPRLSEPKYGQAFIQGNKIVRFLDQGAKDGISIINTGVYVFDPKIFSIFPSKKNFTLEKEVFPKLAQQKQLSASFFQGIWVDVSSPEKLKEAQERWNELSPAER